MRGRKRASSQARPNTHDTHAPPHNRHGQRLSYGRQDVRVSEGVLKPRSLPLPALPNYLAITATTTA